MTHFRIKKHYLIYFLLFFMAACSSSDGGSPNPAPEPVPISTFIMDEITKEETDSNDEMLQTLRVMTSVFVDTKVGDTAEMRINAKKEIDVPETIIGAVKGVMGLALKIYNSQQPDPYLEGIKMLSNQIDELSSLVQSNTTQIMNMIEKYIGDEAKTTLLTLCDIIWDSNRKYLDTIKFCGYESDIKCSEEAEFRATQIYEYDDVGTTVKQIHTHIMGGDYKSVSTGLFEALIRGDEDDPKNREEAALETFISLSSLYFYMSSMQLIGYQLLLEACNCLDKPCSLVTPQDYAYRIYEQTKLYWAEVERLNIYGFSSSYPAGGTRMDNDTTSKGWTDWVDGRVKNIGTQTRPNYTGNQFFLQADMLAATVNGCLQLAVMRGFYDPKAYTYRNLSALSDQWDRMDQEDGAPGFTLEGISEETQDLSSGSFEKDEVLITSSLADSPTFKLWRYVKTDITCPEIFEWYQQGAENQSPTLLSVSATKDYTAWAVGEDGTILYYDGLSWETQKSVDDPEVATPLQSVSALNQDHVWAVGNEGVIVFFDGRQWQFQESGTIADLYGVSALDENHVWAVGSDGVLFFDGQKWATQYQATATETFFGVSVYDENHVWAVGSDNGQAIIYFFDGANWKKQLDGTKEGTRGFYAVSAGDQFFARAVGDHKSIYIFNGNHWVPEWGNPDSPTVFTSISQTDRYHAWVTTSDGEVYTCNGGDWAIVPLTDGAQALQGISSIDEQNIWAVGGNGAIYYYGADAICSQSWRIFRDESDDLPDRPDGLSVKSWGIGSIPQEWTMGGEDTPTLYQGIYSIPYYLYMPECLLNCTEQAIDISSTVLFKNVECELANYSFPYMQADYNWIEGRLARIPRSDDVRTPWNFRLTDRTNVSNLIYLGQPYYLQGSTSNNKYFIYDEIKGTSDVKMTKDYSFHGNAYYTYNATPSVMICLINLNSYPLYENDEVHFYNPGDNDYGALFASYWSYGGWYDLNIGKTTQEEAKDIQNVIGNDWNKYTWKVSRN